MATTLLASGVNVIALLNACALETTLEYFIDMIKSGLEKAYGQIIKNSKSIINEFIITDEKNRYVIHLHVTEKIKNFDIVVRNVTRRISEYKESTLSKVIVKCSFRIAPEMKAQMNRFRNYINQELHEVNVFFPNIRPFIFQKMNNKGIDSSYVANIILRAKDNLEIISRFFENSFEDHLFYIYDGKNAVLLDAFKDHDVLMLNILEITSNLEKIEVMKSHTCINVGTNNV